MNSRQHLRLMGPEPRPFAGMIAVSQAMRSIINLAARVAPTDTTVLLEGESGTGKELLARDIHANSNRSRGRFVTVNCGAIPEQLLESELFGHRRGSFTNAIADKRGKFEAADRGTVFLDEIGELPLAHQVRLLRVLQEREIDKVGDVRPLAVDVRVIAATNRNLEEMVAAGAFREDLYYRLAVVSIRVPPLREHVEDIAPLVDHFLTKHAARLHQPRPAVDPAVYSAFTQYRWPGNVRELANVIERALVLDDDQTVGRDDLPERFRTEHRRVGKVWIDPPDESLPLEDIERELLRMALEKHHWNQTRAAQYLKITRSTLLYRMQKFGLKHETDRRAAAAAPESSDRARAASE